MPSFYQQVAKFCDRAEKKLTDGVAAFYVNFTTALIARTPVGDPSLWQDPPKPGYVPGTLANSWFTTPSSPYMGKVRIPNSGASASYSNASARAKDLAGGILYITNPTPYANMIEYMGWSSQAPAGMTRITAVEFEKHLRKGVRSVK